MTMETHENQGGLNGSQVKGWGVDADPENDPTYPMRNQTVDEKRGFDWERPTQQRQTVEVLRSNEHKFTPAVFGTTVPPSGLSGVIRRQAFRYSESQFNHWILLLLADRINMVEGVGQDLSRGKFPNVLKEMGFAAEWKYNRPALVRNVATTAVIGGAVIGIGYWLLRGRKQVAQPRIQRRLDGPEGRYMRMAEDEPQPGL